MKNLFILLLLVLPVLSYAQEFKISGQLKPRFEHNQGVKRLRLADDNADISSQFVSQRARLSLNYTNKNEKLRFGLSAQDVRTWGDVNQLVDDSQLGIHEAWAEVLFNDQISLKLGRQELVYDDARILGNVDWAQQGRSHDLALFKYEGALKVHAGLAVSTQDQSKVKTPYTLKNYKNMQFLWLHKDFEKLNVSLLFLNNGVEQASDATTLAGDLTTKYTQTVGTRLVYKADAFGADASAYYQGGKTKTDATLEAYDVAVNAYYNIGSGLKLQAGAEFLSGTDQDAEAGVSNSFTPLYGTNHKFNGLMDYFYVGNHGNNVGLSDIHAGLAYKKDKFKTGLTAHFFSAMGKVLDGDNSEMDAQLGTELDFTVGYTVSKEVSFVGGFSTMMGTETMERVQTLDANGTVSYDADKISQWGWVMVVIKPTFFHSKK